MNQEEKYQFESEEIDLINYVRGIAKRKWVILGIIVVAVIAAGVFNWFLPKIYKIDTVLQIGVAGPAAANTTEQLIESPNQLIEKINSDVYGNAIRKKMGISQETYLKIKTGNPRETNLVTMEIESDESQNAKNILEEINNLILKEHQEIISQKIILINQDIKSAEEQILLIESDIEKTQNKIKPTDDDIKRIENKIEAAKEEKQNLEAKIDALEKVLVYQQDPGTQFALFDTKEKLANKKQEIEDLYLVINSLRRSKEDLEVQINSLKASIENLNAQINSLRASLGDIKPTQVVKSPTVSEKPISPRPLLNIVIAAVLGLFAGIFLAFCQEWWNRSKS